MTPAPRPTCLRLATAALMLIGLQLPILPAVGAPAATAAGTASKAPTAETLLRRIVLAQANLEFQGEVDINGESVLTVTHGQGRRQRHELHSPAALAGDVVIDNGSLRWHLSPQSAEADVNPSEQVPLPVNARLALIHKNYELAVLGAAQIAKSPTWILGLRSRHEAGIEHRLFVSGPGLALRTERWRDRSLVDYSVFTSIDWKPKLTLALFEPTLPAGANIKPAIRILASGPSTDSFAGRLTFRPHLPKQLPNGFQVAIVRLYKTRDSEAPTVHWRMTDGLSSLSLFCRQSTPWQMPKDSQPVNLANGVQAARMDRGINMMLIWQAGGMRYSLVGPVNLSTLIATAKETLRPGVS
ncbi:MAG: hypothetical protein H7338_24675 [Candidatus Sericytochromatia bacterium]|nr:hypothetical protein [Candidatus Sericytochromatia bacterium]